MVNDRVGFRISLELANQLDAYSKNSGYSRTKIMIEALEQFLTDKPTEYVDDRLQKVESELDSLKTDILELRNSLRGLVAQLQQEKIQH